MFRILVFFFSLIICTQAHSVLLDQVKKFQWNDLEVVWLPEEKHPTYVLTVYFADGALSDGSMKGTTETMFNLISAGTRRFSQKDIADNLEFFGVSHGGVTNHEYSTYSVSGLVKDIIPTMKKVCHLFNDASFPVKEIKKARRRYESGMKSLVNNHGALSNRIFRELSLEGTPYSYPVGGKLKDRARWEQKNLLKKLSYFNNDVKKRIYITGPAEVKNIEKIITNECGWKGQGSFVRSSVVDKKPKREQPRIVFIKVPKANQSQVKIGRFLHDSEINEEELMLLMSKYLGGGFTARLMRELRVKRGLTYSVYSYAAGQKDYGRSAINTFTKEETTGELLAVVRDVVTNVGAGEIPELELNRAKTGLAGGHLFQFEQTKAFLDQLIFLDHVGRPYKSLMKLPDMVKSFSAKDVARMTKDIFGWNAQTIVVLGSPKAAAQLKEFGKVEYRNYKEFL